MAGIIVDIDRTLLRGSEPIDKVVAWVNEKSKTHSIYVITGRPESRRAETTRALKNAGIRYNRLYMNDLGTSFPQIIAYKKNKAKDLLQDDNISMAIDNDVAARNAYSSLGIKSINPASLPDVSEKAKGLWQGLF